MACVKVSKVCSVLGYINEVSLQCLYKADRIAAMKLDLDSEFLNDQATQPAIQVASSEVVLQYGSLHL